MIPDVRSLDCKPQLQEKMIDALVTDQPAEEFHIDSLETFTWLVQKLEFLKDRIEAHRTIAQKKHDKLKQLFGELTEQIEADFLSETLMYKNQIDYLTQRFGMEAQLFANRHLQGVKGKSFKVGRSQIGYKRIPEKLQIINTDKLVEWCYAQGKDQLVKIEESIPYAAVQDLRKQGIALPEDAIRITPSVEQFFVKVADTQLSELTEHWNPVETPINDQSAQVNPGQVSDPQPGD